MKTCKKCKYYWRAPDEDWPTCHWDEFQWFGPAPCKEYENV